MLPQCQDYLPAPFRALVLHIFKSRKDIAGFSGVPVCAQVPMQIIALSEYILIFGDCGPFYLLLPTFCLLGVAKCSFRTDTGTWESKRLGQVV